MSHVYTLLIVATDGLVPLHHAVVCSLRALDSQLLDLRLRKPLLGLSHELITHGNGQSRVGNAALLANFSNVST